MPEIIGHRGAPREARENTLAGFRRALELGADGIELDVHATRDGTIVVHHDFEVSGRDGAAPLRIGTSTAEELAAHAAGAGLALPTLAAVLDEVAGRATVYVELKGGGTAAGVAALLRGREGWTAVHAFDHRAPRRARAALPTLRAGILLQSYLVDAASALRAAEATDLWQWYEQVDERLVRDVHGAGGRVIAWTVNDPDAAKELAEMGVDALCTDVPADLRKALEAAPADGYRAPSA